MALNKQEFTRFIREFSFRELFNEMGWNNDRTPASVVVDEFTFAIQSVGEKSGFKILVCDPSADGRIPDYSTRKKIETKVRRLFQEHLIIFQNAAKTEQLWQFVSRQTGKPTRITETRWNKNQEPELLFQRASGVFFELDEEDNITIVDVTRRIAENFDQNNERVTKKFYERFKNEHKSFASFLTGIDDHIEEWNSANPTRKKDNLNKQWYVSLMLNRLMFCYFIQKKGFLDKNKNYLRDKLQECQQRRGENQYHSFYRSFLLALFHEGLGTPEHSSELKAEIGRIPYLNGGLFDEHELEKLFENIQIEDEAFEKIFDFFDQYEWHLDTRHAASGRDVNPDVIGYIFEKYINDRAEMGAYYTKEDITDYISKNCVLPFLFDETKRNYSKAFGVNGEIWSMLKGSGDSYIYDAVKKGVDLPLPDNIEIGIDTTKPDLLERRKGWNQTAPETHALPTEIWREVVDRRRRYEEAKAKIESGGITEINDFITYNLNIRQFVQDVIDNTSDPKFLEHFYKALNSVTILDPTCGSGAFLFAAMNIVEPLYEACLQRMRNFIEDEDRANQEDKKTFGHKFPYFREILEDVQNPSHPNLQYFIYKSIILRNLYGVDIMKEAVEVAKLRLFLKLVATVDADYRKPNLGLEPLPDIDFNIRGGNTLVGFANEKELDDALLGTVQGKIVKPVIDERMEMVSRVFNRFKQSQVTTSDYRTMKDDKTELYNRLHDLNDELNRLCHEHSSSGDYDDWVASHEPFHWLAEFYEIVHGRGGFDVIIGNPPYIEYSKVKNNYQIHNYRTIDCNNLWAFVIEATLRLRHQRSRICFIVPMSLSSSKRMRPLQNILSGGNTVWLSNYESGSNPGQLFVGVKQNLSIVNLTLVKNARILSTKFNRFYADERKSIFDLLEYTSSAGVSLADFGFPKIGKPLQVDTLRKLGGFPPLALQMTARSQHRLFVHRIASYYIKCFDFVPYFRNDRDGQKKSEDYKAYCFIKPIGPYVAAINSSLFYLYWQVVFDNFKAGKASIENFPFSEVEDTATMMELGRIVGKLMDDLKQNADRISVFYQATGSVEYDNFYPRLSKPIIDEIDGVLAKHYGFTDEELDFIINYDIKYRMGRELDGESADEG